MNTPDQFRLDERGVRRSFERASAGYDGAAVLQAQVRRELLARLKYVRLEPAVVLDAGCGTGHATRALKRRYRRAQVIAFDIAPGMLAQARAHQGWFARFARVCGDAARLPFADASVDLVYSNLMLQWCNDLDAVLREFRRVLRPGGVLTFTTFGPDTLRELRAAWRAADARTHVNRFIDMHDIGDALVRAGLAEPVLDVERFTLTYDEALGIMRELKAIGAHNVTAHRPSGLTGRGKLAAVRAAYEQFRVNGKLPVTYEVVFGQAWGRPPAQVGVVNIPLDQVRRHALARTLDASTSPASDPSSSERPPSPKT